MHLGGVNNRFPSEPQGDLPLEFRDVLYNSGFSVVGDLSNSDDDRFTVIHRNGGTVESGLSNRSLIESADEGELISLYWIARIDDMNIRRDRDLVEWLSDQDYWFTTWGNGSPIKIIFIDNCRNQFQLYDL